MIQNVETTNKPDTKARTNVYKVTPTFEIPQEELQTYRDEVMQTIRLYRMTLMSHGEIIKWLDKELAKFPEETSKKEKAE